MTTIGAITPPHTDYAEVALRPLEPERAALIVIDIQEKLLPPIFQKEHLVRNSQLLIRLAGVLKIPTLLTTQYSKGLGNTVILCGMESHICVAQTALAALRAGYLVHVASDAVSSRTEWNRNTGLERMRAAGAVISSTEMIIYEALKSSSTSEFKTMLQYLK